MTGLRLCVSPVDPVERMKALEHHDLEHLGVVGAADPKREVDDELAGDPFAVSVAVGAPLAIGIAAMGGEDEKVVWEVLHHFGHTPDVGARTRVSSHEHVALGQQFGSG